MVCFLCTHSIEGFYHKQILNFVKWLFCICWNDWAFQVALVVKNLPANPGDERDKVSVLGLGRSPGRWNDNPLQCACLESPMDKGIWRATVHGVTKRWTWLKRLSTAHWSYHMIFILPSVNLVYHLTDLRMFNHSWRKLSAEELMLLNHDVGEDSWEFLGLQGVQTSQS